MTEARAIAERVLACPGVAGLSGGPFGTVATYLPGERLTGVAVRNHGVDIAIVARFGDPLPAIADEIRLLVGDLADGRPVNVTIDDLDI